MPLDRIRRVLAAKALRHPELSKALTWNSLRRVLAREDVDLVVAPIPKPAMLTGFEGLYTIAVSSRHPARRHTYYASHELGHLWLHVDDAEGRHVRCYNFDDYTSPDPREEEAETCAAWLLGDPEVRRYFDIDQGTVATLTPPAVSLLEALATKRVVRGIDIAPPAPSEPKPRELLQREDLRYRNVTREIEMADTIAELLDIRRRVLLEFANDARRPQILRSISAREDEMIDALVFPTRR